MKPKIEIRYGRLLEPFFEPYIKERYPEHVFLTSEEVKEKVEIFKEEWKKYEDKFINGLKNIGLEYVRNRIDVFIIAATNRDMSAPLILRARYSPEEFISVLCHELIHNLFTDHKLRKDYGYKEETDRTRNHIYTFAILKYLFKDVFEEPERIEKEKSKSSPDKNQEYYRAWEIVEKDGYMEVIKSIDLN